MGALRDTTWPSQFPEVKTDAQQGRYAADYILRTDSVVSGHAKNRVFQPVDVTVEWVFSAYWFSVFEGWYRHNLLRGRRGMTIDLPPYTSPVKAYIVGGYTAQHNQALSAFTVRATLQVLPA